MPKNNASLRGVSPPLAGAQFLIDVEDFSIGRSRECNLVIDEKTISAVHAVIRITEHGFNLVDQNSTNGTFVNGRRVNSIYLNDGDLVRLDEIELQFKSDGKARYISPALAPGYSTVRTTGAATVSNTNSKTASSSRNGFNKPARRLLGAFLALALILICYISGVLTVAASAPSSSKSSIVREVVSATPLMHTHYYYEGLSSAQTGRSIIVGFALILGAAAAGLGFRLISSLSAPVIALYVACTYTLTLFFGHLAVEGFNYIKLERSIAQFLRMDASAFTQLAFVYLLVFVAGFIVSLSTASLLKR